MSENEQNDSYNDVCTLTACAADLHLQPGRESMILTG